MAIHTGWDKSFIGEKFTLEQINRYVEIIENFKRMDARLFAISAAHASLYGAGRIEKKAFDDYLDRIYKVKQLVDSESTFSKMKNMGLPIEEK